jgi:hypothetical protein
MESKDHFMRIVVVGTVFLLAGLAIAVKLHS